ncbi:solute carrier family 66 member 3-like isoform X2 [Branchiostoma floridae x Branchiostoma belcheri]
MASVAIEVLVSFASLSCIVLCVVLKLPQIAAIWSSKSAKGVSLQSTLLEWFCYAVMMCYHFVNEYPLSTYAEYLFLNIQDLALVLIILYFQDRLGLEALLYITGYFIIVSVLSTSLAVAKIMINFVLPMSMASKLIQLRALWTSRDASSVSPTTWFIAFYSCVGPLSLCHLCSDLHNYCGNRRHPCSSDAVCEWCAELQYWPECSVSTGTENICQAGKTCIKTTTAKKCQLVSREWNVVVCSVINHCYKSL